MNENINAGRELDLFDVMAAIFKKWKAVLCVTLAVALLAGGLGFVLVQSSNNSYGATIDFYLKTDKANEYILSLMKSDKFAEILLLDEYGLPAEYKNSEEYDQLLAAKKEIAAKKELVGSLERQLELGDYDHQLLRLQELYVYANEECAQAQQILIAYKQAEHVTEDQHHNEQIRYFEDELEKKNQQRDEIKAEFDAQSEAKYTTEYQLNTAKLELKNLLEDIEKPLEELLNKYRSNPENLEALKKVKSSVSFGYVKEMAVDNKNNGVDINSEAVLKVKVSVPGDSEFAAEIAKAIVQKLPDFIDEKVFLDIKLNSESQTKPECKLISTFSAVEKIDSTSPVKNAVIYAAIGGIATVVVACMVIAVAEVFKRKKSLPQIEE